MKRPGGKPDMQKRLDPFGWCPWKALKMKNDTVRVFQLVPGCLSKPLPNFLSFLISQKNETVN